MVILPVVAQASVFTSFRSWWQGKNEAVEETQGNSQTIGLLQSSYNSYSNLSRGGGEVIIEDDALVAEGGVSLGEDDGVFRPSSDQISIYVVHPGDTLSGIANMFGVSVNTIMWTNNLSSKVVKEGQKLVILPISGVRHTVKSGDTLQSIAKKYKGNVEEITDYNNLQADAQLAVGTVVIVPDGVIAAATVAKNTSGVSSGVAAPAGYYQRPVPGKRTQGIHGQNGVDLAASVGTPVKTSASGQVLISKGGGGWNGGYGNYIVIGHSNGTQTLYAHLASVAVSAGQTVEQGQLIGYSGNTGKSTGPHLHFEVRGAKNPF